MIDKFKNAWTGSKAFAESLDLPGEKGQAMNTILTLIVAGIGLVIGVYVFSEVEGSMDYASGSWVDNIVGDLYGAYGLTL